MATLQLSFPDALAWLEKFTGPMNPTSDPISSRAIVRQQEWSSNADAIWNSATALRGTQGETYLRRRECYVAGATDLRYLKASGKYNSAILARVTDFLTGKPITLLFIDIDPFAGKLGVRFLSGHKKAGGVIRLVPCVNIGAPLGLAEGIETALTVIANGQGPVWSALDAGNLGALAVSPMFPVLNIWADNDPPGLKGAQTLADRWYLSGHNARVIAPPKSGQDWNDHIREKNSA